MQLGIGPYELLVQHSPRVFRLALRRADSPVMVLLSEFAVSEGSEGAIGVGQLIRSFVDVAGREHVKQMRLFVQTGHFALIPKDVYDVTVGLRYLDLTAQLPDGLTAAETRHAEFVNVFAVDAGLKTALKDMDIPLAGMHHQADAQHLYARQILSQTDPTRVVQALVEDHWVSFYVSRQGKTLLANTFLFTTADEFADACRYVNQITQSAGEGTACLVLQGQIVQEGVLYKRVFPFFRQIDFAQPSAGNMDIANLEPHRFFDLRY